MPKLPPPPKKMESLEELLFDDLKVKFFKKFKNYKLKIKLFSMVYWKNVAIY